MKNLLEICKPVGRIYGNTFRHTFFIKHAYGPTAVTVLRLQYFEKSVRIISSQRLVMNCHLHQSWFRKIQSKDNYKKNTRTHRWKTIEQTSSWASSGQRYRLGILCPAKRSNEQANL